MRPKLTRRGLIGLTAAATISAGPVHARRSGDRGTRTTRSPREPRAPRGSARVTVIGVWAIGVVLLLDGTDEECLVVGHDGQGNSICELLR